MKRIFYALLLVGIVLPFKSAAQCDTYNISRPPQPMNNSNQYVFCIGSYLDLPNIPDNIPADADYVWMLGASQSNLSTYVPFFNREMTAGDDGKWLRIMVIETDGTRCYSNPLKINAKDTTNETVVATVCDSYTWHGVTYSASTTNPVLISMNNYGCAKTTHLHLTIKHSTSAMEVVSACDSYSWHGTSYSSSTTATYTTTNSVGCDSVTTLYLTINNSSYGEESATACDNYTWHNTNYSSSTDATFTTPNSVGCDSVITLHLTINNSTAGVETVTACDSYSWHGTTYTSSANTPTYTSTNSKGCDSVTTLHLTINHSNSGVETITACDAHTWHGTTYTSSTYSPTYTCTNSAGCDSVTTLHLTVNHSNLAGVENVTTCDSYSWNNTTYVIGGVYTYSTQTVHGCDSLCTLNLTLWKKNLNGSITEDACDSFYWHDSTYTSSGTYTYSTQTIHGCDSLCTLHLTVNKSDVTGIASADVCDSIVWNDHTYTVTGIYSYATQTVKGCDSLCTLHLIVRNSSVFTDVVTECDYYVWINNEYYSSDTVGVQYRMANANAVGCDSIITLHLTILGYKRPGERELVVKNLGTGSPKMIVFPRNAGDQEYAYRWFRDGEVVYGERQQYYLLKDVDMGGHEFSVYAFPVEEQMCGDTSKSVVLNVQETAETPLRITPNPSDGHFQVLLLSDNDDEISKVTIYTSAGNKVLEQRMDGHESAVEAPLSAGVYTVTVTTTAGFVHSQKIIVK